MVFAKSKIPEDMVENNLSNVLSIMVRNCTSTYLQYINKYVFYVHVAKVTGDRQPLRVKDFQCTINIYFYKLYN